MKFVNERSLTPNQAQSLVRWVEQGRLEIGEDPLASSPSRPPGLALASLIRCQIPQGPEIPASGVFDIGIFPFITDSQQCLVAAAVVRPATERWCIILVL